MNSILRLCILLLATHWLYQPAAAGGPATVAVALVFAFSCLHIPAAAETGTASVTAALQQFYPSKDLPEQRQALLAILQAVGTGSELARVDAGLSDLGYAGNSSWGSPGTSYCWWWGVTCCGSTLTLELDVCDEFQGVSALEVPALELSGTLPDVFGQLPDLQVFMVQYNRGEGRQLWVWRSGRPVLGLCPDAISQHMGVVSYK